MKLVFLGTGGMVPTKERNVTGLYADVDGEGILFDCGEGTQRQMNIAGINRLKVKKVLISHWHGDHVAGLIGLVQTLGNVDEPGTLRVYGPVGTKEYMDHLLKCCSFDLRIKIEITEIKPKSDEPVLFFENDDYELYASALKHSIPCLGYAFVEKDKRKMNMHKAEQLGLRPGRLIGQLQQGRSVSVEGHLIKPDDVSTIKKGKKFSVIMDTEPCSSIHKLVEDADLLIMEANFASSLEEKAAKHKHMTAQVNAQIASQANAKKLVLTHFSQRYKTVEEIEEDAKKVFPNTVCAFDFMKVSL